MGKALILGKDTKHLDKDIELCRTTNERISDQAAQLLIENQIPFTRSFIKIPFFLREKWENVLCTRKGIFCAKNTGVHTSFMSSIPTATAIPRQDIHSIIWIPCSGAD